MRWKRKGIFSSLQRLFRNVGRLRKAHTGEREHATENVPGRKDILKTQRYACHLDCGCDCDTVTGPLRTVSMVTYVPSHTVQYG